MSERYKWSVFCADAVRWLEWQESESIDLIVTDPAYRSLDKHRSVGTTTRLASAWFETVPNEYFGPFMRQCYRVLKPNSHCYVMCDQETMFALKPAGEEAGFRFWKPLVWEKKKMGMGYHYRAQHEFILFFEKGRRKLNSLSVPDVLSFPRVAGGQFAEGWRAKRAAIGGKAYPTEKPVPLLKVLVEQSSSPGDTVADPFMGSGSTGEAALRLGRWFLGCDVSEKAVTVSRLRLGGVK